MTDDAQARVSIAVRKDACRMKTNAVLDRSEGFPERDIWFLGPLGQGSARCPELFGRHRRRHLILPGGPAAPPDPPFKLAYRPLGFTGWLTGFPVGWLA